MKYIFPVLASVLLWASCSQQPKKDGEPAVPKQYRIAYNIGMDSTDSDYQVWSMNLDGSDKRNLVQHKEVSWVYHAFEDRLFFISDRDTCYRCYFLYEMDAFGKNVRRISDLRLEDSWMGSDPKGKDLVVGGRIGKEVRSQLFRVNIKTGAYRQLTNDTAAMYRDPIFSPDGKQIAFAYIAHKRDTNAHEEIWIMKEDGSDMRQLSHYPANDPLLHQYGYKAGPPHWNVQENFISYQSVQAGKSSLYAVTPDGNKQWKLTDAVLDEGWHDWSSDGKWLAVELYDSTQKQYYIGLMDWGTKETKKLTNTSYRYQHAPVFVEVR